MADTQNLCSICFLPIDKVHTWEHGHNAEPVNNGRCCTVCNDTVVIPARLNMMRRRVQQSSEPEQVAKT